MHSRTLSKKLAPYLTAYLFLVSIGLPLNRVYCACVGEAYLTVLNEEHECHHDAVAEMVHHHAERATSCHGHQEIAEDGCQNHDCGDTEAVFAQLDVDFIAEWNLDFQGFDTALAQPLPVAELLPPAQPLALDRPIRGPAPPPLPYGRALLALQQTFLI